MLKVGAFEAKTKLSALLDKVSHGEEVLITKHGKAIARLVPAAQLDKVRLNKTIDALFTLRKEVTLSGLNVKTLRDVGRR